MPIFDAYLMLDWSACCRRSRPNELRNTIWSCHWRAIRSHLLTRAEARSHVTEFLVRQFELECRVLVGFDFAFGCPAGFAAALGLDGDWPAWRRIMDEISRVIEDDEANLNNRFEVGASLNSRVGGAARGGAVARQGAIAST